MKNVPSVYGAGIQTHDPEHESTPITTPAQKSLHPQWVKFNIMNT